MMLSARKLHPLFAAEVAGIDVRRPVDVDTLAEFRAAMDEFAVCVIRHDTPPTNEQHIAFSALLGPMERGATPKIAGTGIRVPHPEIIDQSNLDQDGAPYVEGDKRLAYKRANRLWHTDMSFYAIRATYSALAAHEVPPVPADTEFSDMRAVWDALPDSMKRELDGLVAEHSYWHSRVLGGGPEPDEAERRTRPTVQHPLVHVHKGSGRKALYLASHACGIVGRPVAEGRALLKELMAFATRPEFVFAHRWRLGDVVVWDNLCTMHRATEFDDQSHRRDMRRTTMRETDPNAA
jgi:alpha-ketoglutarate-dependent 2,4-dichlorophenoxyacetate dioxygenase